MANTTLSVSFATCAKCGSTSFFFGLYRGIHGKEFGAKGPPWVQNWQQWPAPTNGAKVVAPNNPDLHVQIYRDPIERYVSAFHSKVACCDTKRRNICAGDLGDTPRLIASLHKSANITHVALPKCLFFTEFVDLVRKAHALDTPLDRHFAQQRIPSYAAQSLKMFVPINRMQQALTALVGFDAFTVKHAHKGPPKSTSNLVTLCDVAKEEYTRFFLDAPTFCN